MDNVIVLKEKGRLSVISQKSKVSQPFFVSVNWIFTVNFAAIGFFRWDAFEFQRRYQGKRELGQLMWGEFVCECVQVLKGLVLAIKCSCFLGFSNQSLESSSQWRFESQRELR